MWFQVRIDRRFPGFDVVGVHCRARLEPCAAETAVAHISERLCAREKRSSLLILWQNEAITDPRFGFDYGRIGRIGFNLLPKMSHVDTQVLAMRLGFRSPNFTQDLAVGQDTSRMPNE